MSYCGLTLLGIPKAKPRLVHHKLWYPSDVSEQAQAYFVAHELGHYFLRENGLAPDEEERLASRVGTALILPRCAYLRDARRVPFRELLDLWPLASPWIHARRLVELGLCRDASRRVRGRLVAGSGAGDVVWSAGSEDIITA